jgi:hypothetical protein
VKLGLSPFEKNRLTVLKKKMLRIIFELKREVPGG